jgi:peptide/nickel transport system permease protein
MTAQRADPRLAWLHRLWSLSTGRFGVVVVLVIGLTALLARFWTPFDPQKVDVANRWDARHPAPARHRRLGGATS